MSPPITDLLPDGRFIVVCGRTDDAHAWRDLIGPARCLAIALDHVPSAARRPTLRGPSDELAWQHAAIAGLDGSGWLASEADAFDPDQRATLILPDALDPPLAGRRRRIGRRSTAHRLGEYKTVVDVIWDAMEQPRVRSLVTDAPGDLGILGPIVDEGNGVVYSCQPAGCGPTAGGDGIGWWRPGRPLPLIAANACRLRVMPLLLGPPVRLHGFVLTSDVVTFPPMEVVSLPRLTDGTFHCAGAVATLGADADLVATTRQLGTRLRDRLDYRGGFSVDGILTADGFRPTDLNARLTSAMEAAPPALRVQLHLVNLLARSGAEPIPDTVASLAGKVFAAPPSHCLYGAAEPASQSIPRQTPVRWSGTQLEPATGQPCDGHLSIRPSPRGRLMTATLTADRIPGRGRLGPLAPDVFRLSDQLFGTDFGDLAAPFDT
jgi:hypothetical protein